MDFGTPITWILLTFGIAILIFGLMLMGVLYGAASEVREYFRRENEHAADARWDDELA